MTFHEKINEFYNNFMSNEDTELEVRFGTKGERITKEILDKTIHKLKSNGFKSISNNYTLKIQCEFNDPNTGRKKISSVRTEISGLPNIQTYCKTNKITNPNGRVLDGIQFTKKGPLFIEKNGEKERILPHDVDEYNFRLSLQKDFNISEKDGIVKGIISNWESSKKIFRYVKRTTYRDYDLPFKIDISIVKMSNKNSKHFMIPTYTILESNVFNNPNVYELEIECDRLERGKPLLYKTITTVISGIQNSNFPIKKSEKIEVNNSYYNIVNGEYLERKLVPKNFIGPSSISLEMHHLQKESEINILNDYCVTDKADGIRKLLFINSTGRVYMYDVNMNIEFTGLVNTVDGLNNTIIDGEHIQQDKIKQLYNNFAAFDIYYYNSQDIRNIPFIDESKQNRLTILNATIKKLKFKGSSLNVVAKRFYKSKNIFYDCKSILNTLDKLPYETDGLILTPSKLGVGKEDDNSKIVNYKKTWLKSFKWKPAEFNTIDFFITTKKNKDGTDDIKNLFEDGISSTRISNLKEYKILILRVGYDQSKHGYINPLESVINNEANRDGNLDSVNNYKPVKFYPMEPSDPNAGECNIILDSITKNMFCENSDIIEDNAIVEFKYVASNKENFKWVPIRVRYDKMAELRAGFKNYGNAYHVAESVWKSIHNPVTTSILSGETEIPIANSDIYYKSSDINRTRSMRDFHNLYIKKKLINGVANDGCTLMDLAVGKAGDIPKWNNARLSFVYGIDISRDNIENKKDGACARYLDMKNKKKRIFDAIFVPGDSSKDMESGEAFYSEKISKINQAIFGKGPKDVKKLGEGVYNLYGKARDGFDIVSCQFAFHYMFENKRKLNNFLTNVSRYCKIGGYFIGTCYDGRKIFNLLQSKKIGDSLRKICEDKCEYELTKQYEHDSFENNESSLGYAIDVYQSSINNVLTEYLVNFDYLKIVMENFGFVLIDELEAQTMQLNSGITNFETAYNNMESYIKLNPSEKKYFGKSLSMSDEEKYVSFLNNYFIFKKVRNIDLGTSDSTSNVVDITSEVQSDVQTETKSKKTKKKRKIVLKM